MRSIIAQKAVEFYSVIPRGVEPLLQAPQACVLSIERRDHG